MEKSGMDAEIIQVLHKDLKLAKTERSAVDNSTYLHSNSFEINTGKLQGFNIDSG